MVLFGLSVALAPAGTPDQAAAVRKSYEAAVKAWTARAKAARTAAERAGLAESRPSPEQAARRMWGVIGGELDQEWTLDPAAWFLRVARTLSETGDDGLPKPLMAAEMDAVRQAVDQHHLNRPGLAPMCMALVDCGDQPSLMLLRKIEASHPDKKVKGVAALGIAMIGRNLGDDPRVMRERLSMLRQAIIEAADVEIDGTTVASLAEDELYIIQNLSKGRVAPDLAGVDSGGRPMKLSSHDGKVVVLLFWHTRDEAGPRLVEMCRKMKERFADDPFELVGVSNDPNRVLRDLQRDGRVGWPNFSDPEGKLAKQYRVGLWPLAYVLDRQRKIHYVGPMGSFVEFTVAAILEEE